MMQPGTAADHTSTGRESRQRFYRSFWPTAIPQGVNLDALQTASTDKTSPRAIDEREVPRLVVLDDTLAQFQEDAFRRRLDSAIDRHGIPELQLRGVVNYDLGDINYTNKDDAGGKLRLLGTAAAAATAQLDAMFHDAPSPRSVIFTGSASVRAPNGGTRLRPDARIVEYADGVAISHIVFETKQTLADEPPPPAGGHRGGLFYRLNQRLKALCCFSLLNLDDDPPLVSLLEKVVASAKALGAAHFVLFATRSFFLGRLVEFSVEGLSGFDVLLSPMHAVAWAQVPHGGRPPSLMLNLLSSIYDKLVFPDGPVTFCTRRDDLLKRYEKERTRNEAEGAGRRGSDDEDGPRYESPPSDDPDDEDYHIDEPNDGTFRRSKARLCPQVRSQRNQSTGHHDGMAALPASGQTDNPKPSKGGLTIIDYSGRAVMTAWERMQLCMPPLQSESSHTVTEHCERLIRAVSPVGEASASLRTPSSSPPRPPHLTPDSSSGSTFSSLLPTNPPARVIESHTAASADLARQFIQAYDRRQNGTFVVFTGPRPLRLDLPGNSIALAIKIAPRQSKVPPLPDSLEHELDVLMGPLRGNDEDVVPLLGAFDQSTPARDGPPDFALVFPYRGCAPERWSDISIKLRTSLLNSLVRIHQVHHVLHGDIAPRNVVLGLEGNDPRWIDFGRASVGHACPGHRRCHELRTAAREMGVVADDLTRSRGAANSG